MQKGDTIVKLPRSLLFGTFSALSSSLGPALCKYSSAFTKAADVLAFFLLHERFRLSSGSQWNVFIQSLPASFSSLLMWSPEEIAALGDTALLHRMMKKFSSVRSRFESIERVISHIVPQESTEWFTHRNFLWAHACIASRSVYYDVSKIKHQKGEAATKVAFPKGTTRLRVDFPKHWLIHVYCRQLCISSFFRSTKSLGLSFLRCKSGFSRRIVHHVNLERRDRARISSIYTVRLH